MTIDNMRDCIAAMYSDTIRGKRVSDLPPKQIIVIYNNMVRRKRPKPDKPEPSNDRVKYEQMSFL